MHEITTAHKLWTTLDTTGKAAYLANCGSGVGRDLDRNCTRTEDAGRRVEDSCEATLAIEDVRIKIMCVRSEQRRDGRSYPVMSEVSVESENPRQSARLSRETATEDGSNCRPGKSGTSVGKKVQRTRWASKESELQGIDVVATIPGSNELQWLDITIRRPTAQTNVTESAKTAGHAAMLGEREKTKNYGNRAEVGPDTVKPISIELGGRMGTQTIATL